MSERAPDAKLDWQKLIETALTVEGSVGNTYNRFYEYSFMNQVLLMMQGVREPVATYKRWQSLGRQVVKGAKAKEIIRPVIFDKKNDQGEVEGKIVRFKAVRAIFALSETTGDELPPPAELPEWKLEHALEALDVKQVPFRMLNGNIQGYAHGRELAINPVATDPTPTVFHELGHIVLGHTTPDELAEYQTHRGLKEFQAEATSFLTLNELEELTEDRATEARGYIQGWLRTDQPPDQAIRQVFTATDTILKAGRPPVAEAA